MAAERHRCGDIVTDATSPADPAPSERAFEMAAPTKGKPYLVPLMSPGERLTFVVLVAAWFASMAYFWVWWLQPEHNLGALRFVINSLLVLWTTAMPAFFFSIFAFARVANPALALPPGWRVAMVVTKAPSEPAEMVQETLLAMLAQWYPHDTWLADEDPSPEMEEWCRTHGVRISTRRGIAEYHRPDWPRRTRCKEGNLAYFYDTHGYEIYDFVAQLDADHVPGIGYLEAMLRPFLDPGVGYVSAPSICDRNADRSWSARGRLQFEATLHGALQAGYTGGLAPLCIGSHYAVRTKALREVGGLGPELAEDHSTTLLMNSGGWRGVHALDADARGDGPNTFADMIVQEFQWSRSLIVILLKYTPRYIGQLSFRKQFQFLFCQFWYIFQSLTLMATVALPVVALITGQAWVGISYVDFFVRMFLLSATLVLMLLWMRSRGWLRPATKVLGWETVLFVFARWPWTLMGVVVAVVDVLRGRVSGFKVTPKGKDASTVVPFRVLAPYIGLSLLCALTVILVRDAGSARGFYVFGILNAALYAGIPIVVIRMQRGENSGSGHSAPASGSRGALQMAAVGGAAATFVLAAVLRLPAGLNGMFWGVSLMSSGNLPISELVRGEQTVQLGVYDWNGAFKDADYIAIQHQFISWLDNNEAALMDLAMAVKAGNRWPLVSVEPWSDGREGSTNFLAAIAGGQYDSEIDHTCNDLAAMQSPVFVRWGHEMEVPTGRYPWATDDPRAYVKAYRHFVDRCRAPGRQFYFVWSPRGDTGASVGNYYPGPDYADQIGLSLYAFGKYEEAHYGHVRSFAENLANRYENVSRFGRTIMIAELGVTGTSEFRRRWLADGMAALSEFPLVKSVVYFDAPDSPEAWGPDWPVPDWTIDPKVFTTAPN